MQIFLHKSKDGDVFFSSYLLNRRIPFIIFSSAASFKIWHKGARLTPRMEQKLIARLGIFASDDFVMQMGLNGLVEFDAVS